MVNMTQIIHKFTKRKLNYLSFIANNSRTRVRRGIVEECCKTSCMDSAIYSYCKIQNVDLSSPSILDSSEEAKEKELAMQKKKEIIIIAEKPKVLPTKVY